MKVYDILIKVLNRTREALTKLHYKLLYGKRIQWEGLNIRKGVTFNLYPNARIVIGTAFINRGCSFNAHELITIGKDCLFGENVKIYDHNHRFAQENLPIAQQGFKTAPVTIGDNCWIGSNVTILKGVTVGNHVVIGANCLITQDIPDNTVVTNNGGFSITQCRTK